MCELFLISSSVFLQKCLHDILKEAKRIAIEDSVNEIRYLPWAI